MSLKAIAILIIIYLVIAYATYCFLEPYELDENDNLVDQNGNIVEFSPFEETLLAIGCVITLSPLIPVVKWGINEWFEWKVAIRIARWIDEK